MEKLLALAKIRREERLKNPETRDPRLNQRMTREARKELIDAITLEVAQDLWQWLLRQPEETDGELGPGEPEHDDVRPGVHYNILLSTRGEYAYQF